MKGSAMDWTVRDLAKMIDHSLLVPSLTADDMEKGCRLFRAECLHVSLRCLVRRRMRR